MRLLTVAMFAIALAGCTSSPVPKGTGEDLTQGVEQCSKHGWGTPEMARCADAARASQRQAIGPAEAAPAPAPAAPSGSAWPWNWF